MFCPKCGQQIPDGSAFCYICGEKLAVNSSAAPASTPAENMRFESSFGQTLRRYLSSSLFLAISILVTITAAISLFVSFNLFAILTAVAMWITYAYAKSTDAPMQTTGLKFNRVLMTISFVLNWVAVGFMVLSIIIFSIMIPIMNVGFSEMEAELEAEIDEFREENIDINREILSLIDELYEETPEDMEILEDQLGFDREELEENIENADFEWLADLFTDPGLLFNFINVFMIVFTVFMVVYTVLLIVFNICAISRFKKFAQALTVAYETGDPGVINFSGVSGWLMACGILYIFGNPISGAAYIVASVWVKKLREEINGAKVQ